MKASLNIAIDIWTKVIIAIITLSEHSAQAYPKRNQNK